MSEPVSGRQALLAQVVDHMIDTGVVATSLRALAADIGSSHRMLIYHFAGQEGLVAAVADEVGARHRELVEDLADRGDLPAADVALAAWRRLAAPRALPLQALAVQVHARLLELGLHERAADAVRAWHDAGTSALVDRGWTRAEARRLAAAAIATGRGLLTELAATGDKRAADAAAKVAVEAIFAE